MPQSFGGGGGGDGGGGGSGGFGGGGLPTSPYGPVDDNGVVNPNFKPEPENDAFVVFTSLYDNTSTTSFTDPITGLVTTIVPAIDSANTGPNNPLQPVAGNVPALARWGSITIDSGAIGVIDSATIEFGGGAFNTPGGTITRNALSLLGGAASASFTIDPVTGLTSVTSTPGDGARVMITNNNFFDDASAPIGIDPNGLLAADPLHPLASGAPVQHTAITCSSTAQPERPCWSWPPPGSYKAPRSSPTTRSGTRPISRTSSPARSCLTASPATRFSLGSSEDIA